MTTRSVTIHYRRPPDRLQVFEQTVLDEDSTRIVTFNPGAALTRPVVAAGRTVLEPGAPVVWTTFPRRWYDVGRFHLADGTFTGFYANILTPVEIAGDRWDTTDLFLDVWSGADGSVEILDEDEFSQACERGWIDSITAARARDEADRLADAARRGAWPDESVQTWTLERAEGRTIENDSRLTGPG